MQSVGLSWDNLSDAFSLEIDYPLKKVFDVIEKVGGSEGLTKRTHAEKVFLSFSNPTLLRIAIVAVDFYIDNNTLKNPFYKNSCRTRLLDNLEKKLTEAIHQTLPTWQHDEKKSDQKKGYFK